MITFDGLMLSDFLNQYKDFFVGARINKIQQPNRRELILTLRSKSNSRQLYINIDPKFYHICFMSEQNSAKRLIAIPQKPPMFCMLLRKYLNNAKIAKINQPHNERIFEIFVETFNEVGDKIFLCLAVELMGKHSNIILYNTDTNIILGCAHNVGSEKSSVREVYGTIPYTYPPTQNSQSFLLKRYGFLNSYKNNFTWTNEIIDNYYANLTEHEKFQSLKSKYANEIKNRYNKVSKSLIQMNYQLKKSADANKFRLWGDLIMANLYNLKDFSDCANVYDYENDKNITVVLDKTKSLKENANLFYKKYNKSKTANIKLKELVENQNLERIYLQQLLYSVESAENISELNQISPEIEGNDKSIKIEANKINCINIDDNTKIYIGKNNKQNDYIVSKLASEDDLWFHTKDCPGSHILLKTQNITNELILYCAKLAKEHSSASNSSKIGVIYTKRKYLRKPPKANLGYVTYRNEKEIIID